MPPVRTVPSRRSRRLSTQEIDDDDWESCGDLLYPDSDAEPTISEPTSPIVLPAATSSPHTSSTVHSTAGSVRTSHARQRSRDHIPRPPNAFICFRSDYCLLEKQKSDGQRDHRFVSKDAAAAWHQSSEAVKTKYKLIAREKKQQHAQMYPGYTYSPGSPRGSGGKGKKRKADDDWDYEECIPRSKPRRGSRAVAKPLRAAPAPKSKRTGRSTRKRSRVVAAPSAPSPDIERSETPELSPNTSVESPHSELGTPVDAFHPTFDEDDFVPTACIPHLNLDATNENKDLTPGEATLAGHEVIYKAGTSEETRDAFPFFRPDGTYYAPAYYASASVPSPIDSGSSASAPSPTDSSSSSDEDTELMPFNYKEVQFTNPFAIEFEDLIDVDRLY
ncbi:hypothetical protein B0H16DRAFT_5758 [Mycena metata]|uniref:HMG box domain-containing protein n=1 Tax=Mycena metata TaxID=1033252 RepID=A0AAD7KKM7_9AGAR|nr:hypothetical protein B0H16DRAFT_5758 [Mycena metata]